MHQEFKGAWKFTRPGSITAQIFRPNYRYWYFDIWQRNRRGLWTLSSSSRNIGKCFCLKTAQWIASENAFAGFRPNIPEVLETIWSRLAKNLAHRYQLLDFQDKFPRHLSRTDKGISLLGFIFSKSTVGVSPSNFYLLVSLSCVRHQPWWLDQSCS